MSEKIERPECRLGYDGDEGIWFDRQDTAEIENGRQLYNECDPIDVCEQLEAENAELEARIASHLETENSRLFELEARIARAIAIGERQTHHVARDGVRIGYMLEALRGEES